MVKTLPKIVSYPTPTVKTVGYVIGVTRFEALKFNGK